MFEIGIDVMCPIICLSQSLKNCDPSSCTLLLVRFVLILRDNFDS